MPRRATVCEAIGPNATVGVAHEVGALTPSVEQGREVRLELCPKKVSIRRATAKHRPQCGREQARGIGPMSPIKLVSPAARYRQST